MPARGWSQRAKRQRCGQHGLGAGLLGRCDLETVPALECSCCEPTRPFARQPVTREFVTQAHTAGIAPNNIRWWLWLQEAHLTKMSSPSGRISIWSAPMAGARLRARTHVFPFLGSGACPLLLRAESVQTWLLPSPPVTGAGRTEPREPEADLRHQHCREKCVKKGFCHTLF